jgi:hypothetical protein
LILPKALYEANVIIQMTKNSEMDKPDIKTDYLDINRGLSEFFFIRYYNKYMQKLGKGTG